jgi:predicted RNA-binding Zn-ribbon protein involved in translation (DUF1610 family)
LQSSPVAQGVVDYAWRTQQFGYVSGESQMKLPSWIRLSYLRTPASKAFLTKCPKCGREMRLVDRSSMSGDDMRTYRCGHCQEEHILDFGTARWKILSDAGKPENDGQ